MKLLRFAVLVLALVVLGIAVSDAQQVLTQQPSSATSKEPFETTLSRTVVLITITIAGYPKPLEGTGFLVGMNDSRLPGDQSFTYLVTNRHVAQAIFKDQTGQCTPHRVITTDVTLNLKTTSSRNRATHVRLFGPEYGPMSWFFPEEAGADLAVLPVSFPPNLYDLASVSANSFMTSDRSQNLTISTGDKLLTVGFFRPYAGTHQFQPMVREGILALVPDDKMPSTVCGAPANVYLADVHVIPGNSGSPMFLGFRSFLGGLVGTSDGSIPYGLLGVVSGYMYEDSDLTLRVATDYEAVLHANSGIAVVVPAEQLKALLLSPPLQKLRDQAIAAMPPKPETPKP
jgi:hypothetical protein